MNIAYDILMDAAAFRGVFRREFLSFGILFLMLFLVWAFEEWRVRESASLALGWIGVSCLVLVALSAFALLVIGLI